MIVGHVAFLATSLCVMWLLAVVSRSSTANEAVADLPGGPHPLSKRHLLALVAGLLLVATHVQPHAIVGHHHWPLPRLVEGTSLALAAVALIVWVGFVDRRRASPRRARVLAPLLVFTIYAGTVMPSRTSGGGRLMPAIFFVLLLVTGMAVLALAPSDSSRTRDSALAVLVGAVVAWTIVSAAVWAILGHLDPVTGRFALVGLYAAPSADVLAVATIATWCGLPLGARRRAAILVLSLGLVATFGRFAIALSIAVIAVSEARARRPRPTTILATAAALGALALVIGVRGNFWAELSTLNARIPIWRAVVDEPFDLLGGGWNGGVELLIDVPDWVWGNAHNSWLQLAITSGAVGVGAMASWLVAIMRRAAPGSWERYALTGIVGASLLSSGLATPGPLAALVLIIAIAAGLPPSDATSCVESRLPERNSNEALTAGGFDR